MQKTYRPGYPLEKRGIYYLARELCAQLSLVTDTIDYGCLEKCYSIWICGDDIPKNKKFSISFIEMSNTRNYGNCHSEKKNYDLLTLVMIRLGDEVYNEVKDNPGNDVLRSLHAVMYPHKAEFLVTVKEYIDFSQNQELWRWTGCVVVEKVYCSRERAAGSRSERAVEKRTELNGAQRYSRQYKLGRQIIM